MNSKYPHKMMIQIFQESIFKENLSVVSKGAASLIMFHYQNNPKMINMLSLSLGEGGGCFSHT